MSNDQLSTAVGILAAMITPAVLISACGTLILSTSNRLARVNDRVRKLADGLEALAVPGASVRLLEDRREAHYQQLRLLMRRARILQRALNTLYLGVSCFVATSIAIGILGFARTGASWVPVLLGIVGAGLLMVVSVLLIVETQVAHRTMAIELNFLARLGGELKTLVTEEAE
ncbi:MAG TPA: DUF2721 domain-containing protein [Blastocatellia bacterium]|nr:DUF2721 domain-containing protein [Blastocatellia bacterium]